MKTEEKSYNGNNIEKSIISQKKIITSQVESRAFKIPKKIIYNPFMSSKRVGVFLYFMAKCCYDTTISFSVKSIINWMGKEMDRHKNGNIFNDDIISDIKKLNEMNLINDFDKSVFLTKNVETVFNFDEFEELIKVEDFANIYLDEIYKILNYDYSKIGNNGSFGNYTVLLVFSYLRLKMPMKLECNENRMKKSEAYDTFYKTIAKSVGLSEKMTIRCIDILVELGLIYKEDRSRVYYKDNFDSLRYITRTTIFCNTYKRGYKYNKPYFFVTNEAYYLKEIEIKKQELDKVFRKRYKRLIEKGRIRFND